MRARRFATLMSLGLACALAACGDAAEGESCDLANGNDDCEEGLICRGPWEVHADDAVCCPAPPAKPGTAACAPKIKTYTPDPSVDAGSIPPGAGGSGGTGGSGGADGSAGTDGSAGADGSAGDGAAGSDAGDASPDASDGANDASDANDGDATTD